MRELDAVNVENGLPDVLDQLFDIGCGGVVTVDNEIGVLGRNLCAADAIPLRPAASISRAE